MDITVSWGRSVTPIVVVSGELDVETTPEFSQVIMALHDVVSSEAVYDFTRVFARDDPARSTLNMVTHKFREFGRCVRMPDHLEMLAPSLPS
jgi:hypothetical protein